MNAMIFLLALIGILSVVLIFRHKAALTRRDFFIGGILAVLCMPSNFIMGIFVFPAYLASASVLKQSTDPIFLWDNQKTHNLAKTGGCIFVIGGILGALNLWLALGDHTFNLSFQVNWIFEALRAGIFEEVTCRMFFFALCVCATKNASLSKGQNLLCYAAMILPHVLLHINQGINLQSIVILSLLYGLPFAIMQRKQNLLSAIGAHSLVDFVRFVAFGG